METVTHNPTEGIYAPVGDYVHALEVRSPHRLLFVAGTMGLDPAGVPGGSLTEQLELIWSNIRAILASASMSVKALGGRFVPTTAIVAQTLVSDWLVEIEVIAAA